jgi:hypothetical protein
LLRERKTNTGGFDLVSMLATTLDDSTMSADEYMGNVVLLIVVAMTRRVIRCPAACWR